MKPTKDKNELRPQPKQEQFLTSAADVAFFGGGAGGGKSFALLLEPLYDVDNGKFRSVVFRRTIPMIRQPGGLLDTSEQIFPMLGAKLNQSALEWTFRTGATVKFAGMELEGDRLNWQGSQIALIGFDEVQEFEESQFWFLFSRNRSTSGAKCRVRCTCNPVADGWLRALLDWWIDANGQPIQERSGKLRWFVRDGDSIVWADTKGELVEKFGTESAPKSMTFISALVRDNKILLEADPAYIANLKALPLVERERLLNGNWNVRPSAGNYFRREWFEVVDHAPAAVVARVRFWDRAASEKKSGSDPDATVGVLLSKDSAGNYYVEDVRKMFATPGAVTSAMVATAHQDGPEVTVGFHQDPASAGKFEAEATSRALDGFDVRFSTATGDKETRAKPISAQCEAGNVRLVRGPWNASFLSILQNFPTGRHDDEVDGLSGAHGLITSQCGPLATAIRHTGSARETQLAGFMPRHSHGFDWPSDHPFRPRGSFRRPLL